MTLADGIATVGAIPGVLALLGLFAGYIRLQSRVKTLEDQVTKLTDVRDKVIRMEAHLEGAESAITTLNDSVQAIGGRMDTFLGAMTGELRAALAGRPPSRAQR